jgi:hypothetical protein
MYFLIDISDGVYNIISCRRNIAHEDIATRLHDEWVINR